MGTRKTNSENYDSNDALRAVGDMWLKFAKKAEANAMDNAEREYEAASVKWAKIAEAAYWQATGDCDGFDFERGDA